MRRQAWLAALAALMLAAGGCGEEKKPQVAPAPKAAIEEQKPAAPEAPAAVPLGDEMRAQKAVEPSPPPVEKPPAAESKPAAQTPKVEAPPPKPTTAGTEPPQTVIYEASYGQVAFDHQSHAGKLACGSCHTTDPPARVAIDKEKAHQMCNGCHQEKGAGPTQCNGCHKKG